MRSVAVGDQTSIELYGGPCPSWREFGGQVLGVDRQGMRVCVPNDGPLNANVLAVGDRETLARSVVMPSVMAMSESYVVFDESNAVGRSAMAGLELGGYVTHFADLRDMDDETCSTIRPEDVWAASQEPTVVFVYGYADNPRLARKLVRGAAPPAEAVRERVPVRILCDDLAAASCYPDLLWRHGRRAPRMTLVIQSLSELDHVRGCGRRLLAAFDTVLLGRSNDLTSEERIRDALRLDRWDPIPFGRDSWLVVGADGTRRVVRRASLSEAPNAAWFARYGMEVSELEPVDAWG